MKVTKVIKTFKDGILTSSKEVEVLPVENPETLEKQLPPKHGKILNLSDAVRVASHAAQKAHEDLAKEIRVLRKKLVAAERATRARTKERNSLRDANKRKQHKIASLEERNEDLVAKLFSAKQDLQFLEQEKKEKQRQRMASSSQSASSSNKKTVSAMPKTPKKKLPSEPVRAIAAKPVKK